MIATLCLMFDLCALKIKTITVLYIGHLATPSSGPLQTPSPRRQASLREAQGTGEGYFALHRSVASPLQTTRRQDQLVTSKASDQLVLRGQGVGTFSPLQPFGQPHPPPPPSLKGRWGSAEGISAGSPKGHSQPLPSLRRKGLWVVVGGLVFGPRSPCAQASSH